MIVFIVVLLEFKKRFCQGDNTVFSDIQNDQVLSLLIRINLIYGENKNYSSSVSKCMSNPIQNATIDNLN